MFVLAHFSYCRKQQFLTGLVRSQIHICERFSRHCATSRREKLVRRVFALLRATAYGKCGMCGKKCVINLNPVWANSNQSVQILESISCARTRLSPSQLSSPDARRSHARITKIPAVVDIITRRI